MTRPSFNSAGAVQVGTSISSIDVARPLSQAAMSGKAWIVLVETAADRTFTTPSGWSVIGTNGHNYAAFIHICGDSEPATVNFAWTGGVASGRAIPSVWNDPDPTNPLLVVGAYAEPTIVTAVDAPGITVPTTEDNDLLISLCMGQNNVKVLTKPASMTQAFQNNTTETFAMAYENAATGATGVRTWTWSGVSSCQAMNFVLKGTPIPQSMGILSR